MSQTRDPNSTYCRRCGAELVWEHPKGSGHYQMSSDYLVRQIVKAHGGTVRFRQAVPHGLEVFISIPTRNV